MSRSATARCVGKGPGPGRAGVNGVALACSLVAGVTPAEPGPGLVHIESDPPGASVETVTGRIGVTPLNIAERDLYPNRYPQQRAHLYGKVIISKPGCAGLVRRVSRDDIRDGLRVRLACLPPTSPAPAPAVGPRPSEVADPVSERRLRQLKVLQELLEEGLISVQQEAEIRRRILEQQ